MGSITLNKPSGGQLTLSPEDGATNETVTIPSVGVGKVLQLQKMDDATSTNINTTNSWVDVGGTTITLTAQGSNSLYYISYILAAEIDGDVANNCPMVRLKYKVNNGSWAVSNNSRQPLNAGDNSDAITHTNFEYAIDTTTVNVNKGDAISFSLQHIQILADSINYNQSGIGPLAVGTQTHCVVMEVAQ